MPKTNRVKGPAPIEFNLTKRQAQELSELNTASNTGNQEDAKVNIVGHIDADGKLYVDNLNVEFIHRWMDCMKP